MLKIELISRELISQELISQELISCNVDLVELIQWELISWELISMHQIYGIKEALNLCSLWSCTSSSGLQSNVKDTAHHFVLEYQIELLPLEM